MTFYLNKLQSAGLIRDGMLKLPDYIRNNIYVVGMDKSNKQVFEDNLCLFCCLTMCLDCVCDLGNTNETGRTR